MRYSIDDEKNPLKFTKNFPVPEDIKRPIPFDEVEQNTNYSKCAELGRIFRHAIVEMNDGTWRWNKNEAIQWLKGDLFDLNSLWIGLMDGEVCLPDHMKLYMQIGYSLCGFLEIYEQHEAIEIKGVKGVKGDESMLDFILRIYSDSYLFI